MATIPCASPARLEVLPGSTLPGKLSEAGFDVTFCCEETRVGGLPPPEKALWGATAESANGVSYGRCFQREAAEVTEALEEKDYLEKWRQQTAAGEPRIAQDEKARNIGGYHIVNEPSPAPSVRPIRNLKR